MEADGIKPKFVFAGNPIIVEKRQSDVSYSVQTYKVYAYEYRSNETSVVYQGSYMPPIRLNLSDIAESCIPFFEDYVGDGKNVLGHVENFEGFTDRTFTVEFSDGLVFKYVVIPGGISKQNYRTLAESGTDIFSERFLNGGRNFFLTTRTNKWRIVIPENELYPMFFLVKNREDGSHINIRIGDCFSGETWESDVEEGICALDIKAVRRFFFDEYKLLVNAFDIYIDDTYSCRIVVELSSVEKDHVMIKFRNSLGVFELLDLSGALKVAMDYEDTQDEEYHRYDSITDSFVSERGRIERGQDYSIETIVPNFDRLRFIMDMIGSDEVYLLDAEELPLRVIPSIEDVDVPLRFVGPQNLTFKFKTVETESRILPVIIRDDDSEKPRVFTKEYDKKFK